MEHAYEAILDAGINPKSLRNTKTGVFIGCSYVETETILAFEKPAREGFLPGFVSDLFQFIDL